MTTIQLPSIYRDLPDSNISRNTALERAVSKALNPGVHGMILSLPTNNRLQAIYPIYSGKMGTVSAKEALLWANTAPKNVNKGNTKKGCSTFVKGVNLAIELGTLQKGDRAYYGLSLETGKMPALHTEEEIKEFAEKLILGESQRVTAGGAAMATPAISTVQTPLNAFIASLVVENNLKEDLAAAQHDVNLLNTEADAVILKIADEVETFFNELEPDDKRANSRLWGVVYVSRGVKAIINFHVTGPTPQAVEGANVYLKQTGKKKETDASGNVPYSTSVVGPVIFVIEAPLFKKKEIPATIEAGVDQTLNVQLEPV